MNADWLQLVVLYLPLGLIGLVRWSLWLVKKFVGFFYVAEPAGETVGSVSVVIPVYLENPDTFTTALASWRGSDPLEIIAVIDEADTACIEIFRRTAAETGDARLRLIVTPVPGKRPALAEGSRATSGDIVALVDSDTVWEPDSLPRLTAPFRNPKVGGVTCRQTVRSMKTLSQKLTGLIFDLRYADEMPFLARAGQGFSCLSGRTALYRRTALLPLLDDMVNETFWGRHCISGEDKRLTYLLQASGQETRYQGNIAVETDAADTMKTLLKQKVRWSRNSWRSDLRALGKGWVWRRPALAWFLMDKSVSTFTVLISPMYLGLSIYLGHWPVAIAIPVWWLVSRGIKALPYLQQHPGEFWMVPVYVVFGFLQGVLKIYALVTMNRQGWLTRGPAKSPAKTAGRLSTAVSVAATGLILVALFLGVIGYHRLTSGITSSDAAISLTLPVSRPPVAWSLLSIGATPSAVPATAAVEATIVYNPENDTIEVKQPGAIVDLSAIRTALGDDRHLEELAPGEWLLKTNLKLFEQVGLLLHGRSLGGDVDWLKLESGPSGFVWLQSSNGSISITGTRITSWDTIAGDFDTSFLDDSGRAYIAVKNRRARFTDTRMDVIDSEIAYLGYFAETSYGISWKVVAEDDTTSNPLGTGILGEGITGRVTGSRFHHNYFGIYIYGAGDMVWQDNRIYDNYGYGFDAHTVTRGTILRGNKTYGNGLHGIIFAEFCTDNVIENNLSYDNDGHGIMLHESSDGNIVTGNEVYGNNDGIALFESSNNLISGNTVRQNVTGIRIYGRTHDSSGNTLTDNDITGNTSYGIYIYDAAVSNFFEDNRIQDNGLSGIYLKGVTKNSFIANSILGNDFGIRIDSSGTTPPSTGNVFRGNTIAENRRFGIYSFPGAADNQLEENLLSGNLSGDVRFVSSAGVSSGSGGLLSIRSIVLVTLVIVAVLTIVVGWLRRRATSRHG